MKNNRLKEMILRFRQWREQPHQVAPMAEVGHDCATCGTHYTGNYCPRCGQSARIGRFSFKTGILNFLDVWGLGNRNMFLTIRDLILRPGYMIRDYLKGMQMAYFPPFKMFFLLAALSLLVTHGLNIKGENLTRDSESKSEAKEVVVEEPSEDESIVVDVEDMVDVVNAKDEIAKRTKSIFSKAIDSFERFQKRYPNIYNLLLLMVESVFLYLFFRRSPNIPDLSYSELFVAQVYIVNMVAIYTNVFNFFCLTRLASFSSILAVIPLKQLSGFSWWRTVLKTIAALLLMLVAILLFIVLSAFVTVLLLKWFG